MCHVQRVPLLRSFLPWHIYGGLAIPMAMLVVSILGYAVIFTTVGNPVAYCVLGCWIFLAPLF